MGFVENKKFYEGIVYEWNLPTGHSCPYAKSCKVSVNKETGKFKNESDLYYCYAAKPERFPGVRDSRWANFEKSKAGEIQIPKKAKHIRIHASGDFYSQKYFDLWLQIARENPSIEFWAYTKSLRFWIKRENEIPKNLELTASFGGHDDNLIIEKKLKNAQVFPRVQAVPASMPIDHNDSYARNKKVKAFALIDNSKVSKKGFIDER